jgi:hypothetical protein
MESSGLLFSFVGSIVNLYNCCYFDSTRIICMLWRAYYAWWCVSKATSCRLWHDRYNLQGVGFGASHVSASINLRKLVLSPTGSINLGFILREDLLLCSSYLPLGVPNWVDIYTSSRTATRSSTPTTSQKWRCTETIFSAVFGCQGSYLGELLKVFAFTTHISDVNRMPQVNLASLHIKNARLLYKCFLME